jgi:hypothetical protein
VKFLHYECNVHGVGYFLTYLSCVIERQTMKDQKRNMKQQLIQILYVDGNTVNIDEMTKKGMNKKPTKQYCQTWGRMGMSLYLICN